MTTLRNMLESGQVRDAFKVVETNQKLARETAVKEQEQRQLQQRMAELNHQTAYQVRQAEAERTLRDKRNLQHNLDVIGYIEALVYEAFNNQRVTLDRCGSCTVCTCAMHQIDRLGEGCMHAEKTPS